MQQISITDRSKLKDLVEELTAQSFYTNKYEFLLSNNITIYGYFKDKSGLMDILSDEKGSVDISGW